MPSAFRTQKNLPDWIELDYHRRQRKLRRWRRLVTWGTLALCLAGIAAASLLPRSSRLVQAGPLSPAHGMFNDDCARCHQENFQTAKKLFSWDDSMRVVSDKACTTCHDGPLHNIHAADTTACASCHREHRGRIRLTDVPDGQCLSCHRDLKNHRKGGDQGLVFADVTGFRAGEHPEFSLHRNKEADPGRMHFNHQAHLKQEGILGPDRKLVQMQCVSCHRTDNAGRYMEPIRYDKDCASCHKLSVQLVGIFKAENPDDQKKLDAALKEFNSEPAPHREPQVVRGVLRDRLLAFVQQYPVVVGEKRDTLVDRDLFGKQSRAMPSDAQWNWMKQNLAGIQDRLFTEQQKSNSEQVLFDNAGGCRFCHVAAEPRKEGDLPRYELSRIKPRWLTHARFNHERHRMLNCGECHDAAASSRTSDVLMPRIESCQKCHNDSAGARHDCAECHQFHSRSLEKTQRKGMSIEDCLGK